MIMLGCTSNEEKTIPNSKEVKTIDYKIVSEAISNETVILDTNSYDEF